MIVIIEALSITFVIFYLMLYYITYSILKDKYKYYKPTYLAIKRKDYLVVLNPISIFQYSSVNFRNKDKMVINWWETPDDEIIYFKESESIKLTTKGVEESCYIHKSFMFWFDPYTYYWYHMIKKQIMINSSVENMRDYKLKQLNIK